MSLRMRLIGFLATTLIAVTLLAYIAQEPTRRQSARAEHLAAAVAGATDLYALHCAECHGAAGEGLGVYRALNQEFVRGQDARLLFNSVAHGRPGTEMAAFLLDENGPLTHAQIDTLVLLLQNAEWESVAARVAELGLTPEEIAVADVNSVALGDLAPAEAWALGHDRYAVHCVACHGENGEGTFDAPGLNTPYVANMPESQITEILTLGVRNTDMESFTDRLSDQEIAALVYSLKHWDAPAASQAAAAPAPTATPIPPEVLASGQQFFETWCAVCHGLRGEGGSIAPSLNDIPRLSADFITSRVRSGKNAMPPFPVEALPDETLAAVIAYAQANIIGSVLPVLDEAQFAQAEALYTIHCAECHGGDGAGVEGQGPRIAHSPALRANVITNFVRVGSAEAAAFPVSALPDADLRLIVAYVHHLSG